MKSQLIINLAIVLSTWSAQSQEWFEISNSEDDNFSIVCKTQEIGDSNTRFEFLLIDNLENDTSKLLNSVCHDLPRPNFFWLSENHLVYERRDETDAYSSICIQDVSLGEELFKTVGIIPLIQNQANNLLDRKNNILIFYRIGTDASNGNFEIIKLDLNSYSVQSLTDLSCKFHLEFPVGKVITETRRLELEYFDLIKGTPISLSCNY